MSVGPTHAGLAFHAHGAAWLATVRGSKLFMLFPPSAWPVINARTVYLSRYCMRALLYGCFTVCVRAVHGWWSV